MIVHEINAELVTEETFEAVLLDEESISVEMEVSPGSGEHFPDYEGDYTVVPDKERIVLSSRNTVLRDDVIITSIPAYRVANQYGTTFTIGS